MKRIHSILCRVLLGGLLIAAMTPYASCGGNAAGMKCSGASCCKSSHGCHHPVPKNCRHLMDSQVEGAVFAKPTKAAGSFRALPVAHFAFSPAVQSHPAFQRFASIPSPPGCPLVLRI